MYVWCASVKLPYTLIPALLSFLPLTWRAPFTYWIQMMVMMRGSLNDPPARICASPLLAVSKPDSRL